MEEETEHESSASSEVESIDYDVVFIDIREVVGAINKIELLKVFNRLNKNDSLTIMEFYNAVLYGEEIVRSFMKDDPRITEQKIEESMWQYIAAALAKKQKKRKKNSAGAANIDWKKVKDMVKKTIEPDDQVTEFLNFLRSRGFTISILYDPTQDSFLFGSMFDSFWRLEYFDKVNAATDSSLHDLHIIAYENLAYIYGTQPERILFISSKNSRIDAAKKVGIQNTLLFNQKSFIEEMNDFLHI